MRRIVVGNYERITKRQAEVRYNAGEELVMVPCKCSPESVLASHIVRNVSSILPFNKLCNEWTWYNGFAEVGYYPAFYRLLVRAGEKRV